MSKAVFLLLFLGFWPKDEMKSMKKEKKTCLRLLFVAVKTKTTSMTEKNTEFKGF